MAATGDLLKLDELVTRRYRLGLIYDAFADLREGRSIRGVIEFQSSLRSEP
jgi:S-(hydroxymethyl)glutathione dehydrogenase/alcohol dehydrogenase